MPIEYLQAFISECYPKAKFMKTNESNQNWFTYYQNSLQGNIVRPHGRDFARLIFFQFDAVRAQDTKKLLSGLARDFITSAGLQKKQSKKWNPKAGHGELFIGLYLTHAAYVFLDQDSPFNSGSVTNGTPSAGLQKDGQVIHCMLLLAHDGKGKLDNHQKYFEDKFADDCGAKKITAEEGNKLIGKSTNPDGSPREYNRDHFGYADGISDPVFFANGKGDHYDATADIKNFIAKEPGTQKYGSFLVYMKLEQDIQRFKDGEAHLRQQLETIGAGDLAANAAAMMIGRTQNGTPVADPSKNSLDNWNDFNYDHPEAAKCPFHAHIRKMNNRQHKSANQDIKILRRGIPYGREEAPEWKLLNPADPQNKKGLLFLSFQQSIEVFNTQLALAEHSEESPGIDPIIGFLNNEFPDDNTRSSRFQHEFPAIRNRNNKPFRFDGFGGFVRLESRVDLFAPSLDFLKNLT